MKTTETNALDEMLAGIDFANPSKNSEEMELGNFRTVVIERGSEPGCYGIRAYGTRAECEAAVRLLPGDHHVFVEQCIGGGRWAPCGPQLFA